MTAVVWKIASLVKSKDVILTLVKYYAFSQNPLCFQSPKPYLQQDVIYFHSVSRDRCECLIGHNTKGDIIVMLKIDILT